MMMAKSKNHKNKNKTKNKKSKKNHNIKKIRQEESIKSSKLNPTQHNLTQLSTVFKPRTELLTGAGAEGG